MSLVSLDCGLPVTAPSPYNEQSSGLRFSSDATFIRSGKTGKIQANLESDYLKPYTSLRYFPEGIRNCYSLSVEKNRKYLIRARLFDQSTNKSRSDSIKYGSIKEWFHHFNRRSVRSEKSFTSESSRELGDEDAGYGESGEKRPTTFPLPLEEHWPWIEQSHLSFLSLSSVLLPVKIFSL